MSTPDNAAATSLTADLPGIVQKIEANWPILPSGIWNSSSLQKLLRYLHEVAIRCESTGAEELYRLITETDGIITEIIDDNAPPEEEQLDKLSQNLQQLQAIAGRQSKPAPKPAKPAGELPATPYEMAYLCSTESEAEAFSDAISSRLLQGFVTTESEALQVVLSGPGTQSLLVDSDYLGTQALEPILHLLKINRAEGPTLFVISDQSTMEKRLDAMRAGAVHLFTRPLEMDRLIDVIQTHLHPTPQPRSRVLIVEDDEAQASFAETLLRKRGLDTRAITDPLGVMDAVARFQPDLILMDLYMPGADGIELTRVIRDRWESSAIPVVFLSGEGDPDKKLLALQAGADDFLTKPVPPQQLLATVTTRIQRAHQIAAVALKQTTRPGDLLSRRELLNQLDLALGEERAMPGYLALLVIVLADKPPAEECETDAGNQGLAEAAVAAIRPALKETDQLAIIDQHRLALLCLRGDEVALESLANRLYKTVSGQLTNQTQASIGIGMVLLNGEQRDADQQLCRGEQSAESAQRQNLQGYALYGETPHDAPTPTGSGLSDGCSALSNVLKEGSLDFRTQRYSSHRKQAAVTVELQPNLPQTKPADDPYRLAADCNLSLAFDQLICRQALRALGSQVAQGRTGRLLFFQSACVVTEPNYVDFIKTELRRLQIVGTGLMVEFDLPALAANLKLARGLIGELEGMGITVALGNFTCNETAYKVLAYLRADAIRPHRALLRIDAEKIQTIVRQVHSLHAEIILPRIDSHDQIALGWREFADYIQADFSN
jgi:DNA-binding response OmpR family regulator/EAL domain-containing protein (putative c-di-GMP-specific phosphodiesterase class I)